VLFLDDDVLASPGLVAAHARAHAGAEEDRVVIGTLLAPDVPRSPWVRWELDTGSKQYEAMREGLYLPTPRQFYTGNASVRLEHVRAIGGFDVDFTRAEDVELAFRLLDRRGLRFVFREDAAAVHMADRSLRSWLRAARQYGRNDVVLGTRRGRPDMLQAIAREFWERNRLTRALVRWGLRLPGAEGALALPAMAIARVALGLRLRRLSHAVCSALFSLAYWRGVGDELGAPAAARQLIRQAAPG
jgi:GT2 family glycosyltransferase